jgi:hypothetical protein
MPNLKTGLLNLVMRFAMSRHQISDSLALLHPGDLPLPILQVRGHGGLTE